MTRSHPRSRSSSPHGRRAARQLTRHPGGPGAPTHRDRPGNQRILLEEYARERGPILVGPNADRRVEGDRRRPAVPARLLRRSAVRARHRLLLDRLRGDRPRADREPDPVRAVVALRSSTGAAAVRRAPEPGRRGHARRSTARRRRRRSTGCGARTGAVVAIEPRTGRILARCSSRPSTPTSCPATTPRRSTTTTRPSRTTRTSRCSTGRSSRLNPPGSTFKVVTAAAALASGRFTPDCVIPGPAHLQPARLHRGSATGSTGRLRAGRRRHAAPGPGDLVQHRVRLARQRARRRRPARPGPADRLRRVLRDPPACRHLAVPRGPGRAADRHVGHRAVRRAGHHAADGHGRPPPSATAA